MSSAEELESVEAVLEKAGKEPLQERAMSSAEELESVEAVLEKAGEEPLQERELRELRRILYGKEAA